MMDKKDKAERLLDSIGNVDDSLIDEAIGYKARRRVNLYHYGLMAACIALVFVIAVASPLLRKLAEVGNGGANGEGNGNGVVENTNKNEENDDEVVNDRLGTYMLSIRDSLDLCNVYPSADSLSYTDSMSLVWQYADGEEVYVAPLSASQLSDLMDAMGSGKEVGENSPELDCYVWIIDGQGAVVSPYLKEGAGNEGCAVFDYEAEIIPDGNFVECVSEILK
jgi:hypothetical protein